MIVDVMMGRFGREYEVSSIARRVATAGNLAAAVRVLEEIAPGLLDCTQVQCAQESSCRSRAARLLIEPIGRTGWCLAARRSTSLEAFGSIESATIAALASAITPAFLSLLQNAYT
jgi:hypothetical protein